MNSSANCKQVCDFINNYTEYDFTYFLEHCTSNDFHKELYECYDFCYEPRDGQYLTFVEFVECFNFFIQELLRVDYETESDDEEIAEMKRQDQLEEMDESASEPSTPGMDDIEPAETQMEHEINIFDKNLSEQNPVFQKCYETNAKWLDKLNDKYLLLQKINNSYKINSNSFMNSLYYSNKENIATNLKNIGNMATYLFYSGPIPQSQLEKRLVIKPVNLDIKTNIMLDNINHTGNNFIMHFKFKNNQYYDKIDIERFLHPIFSNVCKYNATGTYEIISNIGLIMQCKLNKKSLLEQHPKLIDNIKNIEYTDIYCKYTVFDETNRKQRALNENLENYWIDFDIDSYHLF
jgi:hypothetical protein